MIMEIPQPITCFISKKSEIPSDHAAPRRRAPCAGARVASVAGGKRRREAAVGHAERDQIGQQGPRRPLRTTV
jgi:hypothetical protein